MEPQPNCQPSYTCAGNEKYTGDEKPFRQIKHILEYSPVAVPDQRLTDAEMMMNKNFNVSTHTPASTPAPQTDGKILDLYFLKARAATLDIAAMLDRLARAEEAGGPHADDRKDKLHAALCILTDSAGDKARRIQEAYSIKG